MLITKCECGNQLLFLGENKGMKSRSWMYARCEDCKKRWTIFVDADGNEIRRKETKSRKSNKVQTIKGSRDRTLCWKCENARGNGCIWFTKQKPVEGWEAVEGKRYGMTTYAVISCPEFKPDRGAFMNEDDEDDC